MKFNLKKILLKLKNKLEIILIKILEKQKFNKNFSLWKIKFLLSYQFKNSLSYKLNLKNPKSFNEKLQWLKLFYQDPLMTQCSDKYLVRDYVKKTVGDKHLTSLLGVYNNPEEINFYKLPKSFVVKVNWGSGQNIIVKDKNKLNIKEAKAKLKKWLEPKNNHYYFSFEWPYKNIQPKIIIEEHIGKESKGKYDYKFFCFNGQPKFFYITENGDDHSKMAVSHYDIKFNQLMVKIAHYPLIKNKIVKPNFYQEMLNIAKKLAAPFPFCRVDFFNFEESFYIGELTFFPTAGIGKFEPKNYDLEFGKLLKLPKKKT